MSRASSQVERYTRTTHDLPYFSLVFCATQTRTKPALPCGDGKARQTGTKLALPCYFLVMCGDDKARQKIMLCLATVVMCAYGKVEEHALHRDYLVLCALLLFGFVFSQVHTHTQRMVMHWSNGGGSFGSDGRNYAARLLL